MPVLPTYTAPGDTGYQIGYHTGGEHAAPSDFGADAAGAARDFGHSVSGDVKEVQNVLIEDDTRDVLVKVAALKATYSNRVRDAALTGEDLGPIEDKLNEDIGKLQAGAQTRQGMQVAQIHGIEMQSQFAEGRAQVQSARYGSKLKQDISEFDNSAAIRMQAQPGLLPQILQEREQLLSTFAGRLPPELVAAATTEGKEKLTVAAASSWIAQDPNSALHGLTTNEGVYLDLTPAQRTQLVKEAETAVKAQEYDKERAYREQQREQKEKDDFAMNGMLQDFANGAGTEWESRRILALTAPTPEQKLRMLSAFEHLTAPETNGHLPNWDPVAANQAYQNIFRQPGDPQRIQSQSQIDQLIVDGKIDMQEHQNLSNAFQNREKPESKLEANLIARAEQVINPRDAIGNFIKPEGAANAYRFRSELNNVEQKWIKNGGDIATLLDPDTKDFKQNVLPILRKYSVPGFGPTAVDQHGNAVPKTSTAPSVSAPTVRSQADIDKLPPGAKFRGPNDAPGIYRTKPAKPAQPGKGPRAAPSSKAADPTQMEDAVIPSY